MNRQYPRKLPSSAVTIKVLNPDFCKTNSRGIHSFFQYGRRKPIIEQYCERSSLHGLKYIMDESLEGFERKLWSVIFGTTLAIFVYLIFYLKFSQKSEIQTVIQNASYSVSDIPFPALTICPIKNIDWSRLEAAENRFLPNASASIKSLFRSFLEKFENFYFEKIESFRRLRNFDLTSLDHLNLKEVLEFLTIHCDSLFRECKWKDRRINCCEKFRKRVTESGLCYTFNALLTTSEIETERKNKSILYKSSVGGMGSGLSVRTRTNFSKEDLSDDFDGIMIRIHLPEELPLLELVIPVSSRVAFKMDPVYFTSSEDIKKVKSYVRQCVFEDEVNDPLYFTLPNHVFTHWNCQRQCRRNYTSKLCNCVVDLFHPLGNERACVASDFRCLSEHYSIFSRTSRIFEPDMDEGMICYCLQSCNTLKLSYTPTITEDNILLQNNEIYLTISYSSDTLVKYETFLSRNWFDYLVYYGGVASFFLGCSLLSLVEIVYFLTVRLICHTKKQYNIYPK